MAEQSISQPVTPAMDGGNSRRNSMGKASSSGKEEKILPHYLRASTGSCHDFCKYGKKHAFEEKARHPFPRRMTKKSPDDQNSAEFQTEKSKTFVAKLKPSPNSKSHAPNTPEIIKRDMPTQLVHSKTPVLNEVLAKKKTSAGSVLTNSFDSQSPVLREVLAKQKTLSGLSLTKSFESQSSVLRGVLAKKKTSMQAVSTESADGENSATSEILVEKKKTSVQGRREPSVAQLRTSPDLKTHISPKIIKQVLSSSSEKGFPLKQASSVAKEVNLSSKPKGASSLKPKLSSPDASRVLSGRQNSDVKAGQRTGTPKLTVKKVQTSPGALLSLKTYGGVARGVASPRASLSSKPSLIRVASLNAKKHRSLQVASRIKKADAKQTKIKNADPDQPMSELKEPNNDVVPEKTLYVIKMEADNKYLESVHNECLFVESSPPPLSSPKSCSLPKSPYSSSHDEEDEEESEYNVTEVEDEPLSEYDETKYMEEAETLEGEHKGKHRKAGMVPSEDKDGQPVKLRFRRGKVVDIQSENNVPRRLKFRRGRMLGENQNIKADARRNFKRRADGDMNDSKRDSEKVVLRHQDAHGKKDAQGLFNNVIEETASKLVETRKSKVKALVGAFETVISLQDTKPSANILS